MNIKQAFVGTLSLLASVAAPAAVLDLGAYTLTYDQTTVFGDPTLTSSGPGNAVSFEWSLGSAVNYINVGPSTDPSALAKLIILPAYTVTANAGFTLSGPVSGLLGTPIYSEFTGAAGSPFNVTNMKLSGVMSVNGGAGVAFEQDAIKTPVISVPGLAEVGTMKLNLNAAIGSFTSFVFNGALILSSTGTPESLSLAAIQSRTEDVFQVSFLATPVPVPPAAWLFSSALIGLVLGRRRSAS